MKFYLSSYQLGNKVSKLKELIPMDNRKTAYIPNALDFSDDLERRDKSEQLDIAQIKEIGLEVERVDLRQYFNKPNELAKELTKFGVIWIRGGNTFVLRQAMKLSGLDNILKSFKNNNILYGGYSAGICVLAPTLKGLDLVDDPTIKPYEDQSETIWDGLNLISYSIVPHYRSDHPEAEGAEQTVKYMIENKIPFKVLKDGEVIIIE